MRHNLLLATLTAIALVGAPLVATAQVAEPETQSESRDLANYAGPEGDSGTADNPDTTENEGSEPTGGEGSGGSGGADGSGVQ